MTREELKSRITSELGTARWDRLAPHAKSENLILLDASLDLVGVAVAVADNDADQVQPWIESGLLAKPDSDAQDQMKTDPSVFFRFVVVAPFVLAQRIPLPD